jgi:hypothetical protein
MAARSVMRCGPVRSTVASVDADIRADLPALLSLSGRHEPLKGLGDRDPLAAGFIPCGLMT